MLERILTWRGALGGGENPTAKGTMRHCGDRVDPTACMLECCYANEPVTTPIPENLPHDRDA